MSNARTLFVTALAAVVAVIAQVAALRQLLHPAAGVDARLLFLVIQAVAGLAEAVALSGFLPVR